KAVGLPPELHARVVDRLRRAYRAGLPLAFGTDLFFTSPGLTYGQMAITFVDSSIEAGLPPKAILQQLIPNAARLLGVDKERGAIRVGMAADLVATPGNPLDDVSELKRLFFVMKDG